jgi:hypothetical protein
MRIRLAKRLMNWSSRPNTMEGRIMRRTGEGRAHSLLPLPFGAAIGGGARRIGPDGGDMHQLRDARLGRRLRHVARACHMLTASISSKHPTRLMTASAPVTAGPSVHRG